MIGFYLLGVIASFVMIMVALNESPDVKSDLGSDMAFAAFAAMLWPFTLVVILLAPMRK